MKITFRVVRHINNVFDQGEIISGNIVHNPLGGTFLRMSSGTMIPMRYLQIVP